MKKRINIAVIGHLDHGKSTLIGRLLFDSEALSKEEIKEIIKIKKNNEELEYSLFLDTLREERQNQLTLDTTQVILKARKLEYNFIDCPGHREFIKNMLTGTSQAEYAILVVSAKLNEGIEKQTTMHIILAKLLGIRKLFVVINKMDAVNYKKERFFELKDKLKDYLRKINFYKKTIFIPISAKKGENTIRESYSMKWYKGGTLLKLLNESANFLNSKNTGSLRILIQDIYFEQNKNILIGRIAKGTLRVNDWIFLNLSKQKGKVRQIVSNQRIKRVSKEGECIGIAIENIDLDKVKRGEVISSIYSRPQVRKNFQADIFFLNNMNKRNLRFLLKCGLKETYCRIELMGFKDYIYKTKVFLNEALTIESVLKTPHLGRFILVDKNGNIAGLGNVDV